MKCARFVAVVLGFLGGVVPSRAAFAEPAIVVEAVVSADLPETPAIALLLRQALMRERRAVVAGLQLQAAGGELAFGQVSLPPASADKLLKDMGLVHRVQGKLTRTPGGLVLEVAVYDREGRQVGRSQAVEQYNLSLLVEHALLPLRHVLGATAALPNHSAAQLNVFAGVERHLLARDDAAAAADLAFADPTVAAAFSTARDIARLVWMSPAVPLELRLGLVGRFGLPGEVAALATNASSAAQLARVRASFALSDLAAAASMLAQVPPATAGYWEVAFELAGYQGDATKRALAFDKLIAQPSPFGVALLAGLPSRALSPAQERQALAAAAGLGSQASHLAAQIAMRMVANDIDRTRALAVISPVDLRVSDVTLLRSALEQASAQGDAHAETLLAAIASPTPPPASQADAVAAVSPPVVSAPAPRVAQGPVGAQLIGLFDALRASAFAGRCVVVGWLSPDSFWQWQRLDRGAVFSALREALPVGVGLQLGDGQFRSNRLVDRQVAAYGHEARCEGVLLVGVSRARDGADVEGFLYDAATNGGSGYRVTVVGANWYSLNWGLGALMAAAAVLAALGARALWRQRLRRVPEPTGEFAPSVVAPPAVPSMPPLPVVTAPSSPPAPDIAERLRPTPRRTDGEEGYLSEGIMAVRAARASLPPAASQSADPTVAKGDQVPTVSALADVGVVAKLAKQAGAEPQTLLGRYRVIAEVGRGAVGVVYQAYDMVLERSVAIKTLSSALRDNPQAAALFAQEAKSLAQLNHTNIVTIYDQAATNDETYLIMEFVAGVTIRELAKHTKPMAPVQALGYMEQLCEGLAYAHGKRVIHRDIKPANIFLARDGTVKLGDFGLARVVSQLAIAQTAVRGTPLYMAPEQVEGVNIDHRADIYAVGCTLYDLLTGRPPFIDGNAMFHHVKTAPALPSSLESSLGPEVDEIVMACLAKRPDDRIQTAKALQRVLRRIIKQYRQEALAKDAPAVEAESPSWP